MDEFRQERCYHRFSVPGVRLYGPVFDAPVVNLSKSGLAIATTHELEPGASFSAWLETGTDRSWVEGRVVWCEPKVSPETGKPVAYEAGLSVQAIEPEAKALPQADASAASKPASATRSPEAPPDPSEADQPPPEPSKAVRGAPRVDVTGMRLRAADLDAEVVNFSSRGLAVRLDRALEHGRVVDGRLETPDGAVNLNAIVVWCNRLVRGDGFGAFAAGLALRDVDQRLDPLAQDFMPPTEGSEEPETAEGSEASEAPEAIEWPEAETPVRPDATDQLMAEAAPWLTEITDDSHLGETRPRRVPRALAWGGGAAVVLALGASALWFGTRGAPEAPAPARGVTPEPRVAVAPVTEPAALPAAGPGALASAVEAPASTAPDRSDLEDPEAGGAPTGEAVLGSIVPRAGVNVRGGPGLEYPILRQTSENERLPFVARQGEWYQLRAEQESWMHEVTVLSVEGAPEPPA